MQLSAFDSNHFFLGHSAMLVNEGLPAFVINRLKQTVNLSRKTVGILGMAFKADSDDPRESLSYKLKKILEMEAEKVLCSDLYIQDPNFVETQELIRKSDIILLATPHRGYKNLKFKNKHIVDIWNFFPRGKK
jgi:UDP-N-acetyl-D-mannosaminuronic acid dehydrogenase